MERWTPKKSGRMENKVWFWRNRVKSSVCDASRILKKQRLILRQNLEANFQNLEAIRGLRCLKFVNKNWKTLSHKLSVCM